MGTTELALPEQLLDVYTGELLPATPSNASYLLRKARELRDHLLLAVKDCEAVLLEESRRQGTKTLRIDEEGHAVYTATISGGNDYDWNFSVLVELLDLGLPRERYHELVVETRTYKVDARVAKQLAAANPEYAKIIEQACTMVEKPWRVSVR